jgi:hypothetical protein
MAFPVGPTNGQQYTVNGVTYVYDSTMGVWDPQGSVSSASPVSSVAGRTGAVTLSAADIATGTFPGALTMNSTLNVVGALTAGSFNGPGTGLTGTAASLSIGGSAGSTTTATNQSGGTVNATTGAFSGAVTLSGNNGITFGPNSSWSAYLKVGGNGIDGTTAQIAATNGNLHLESLGAGYPIYLNYYRGGGVNINGATAVTGAITATTSVTAYYSDERLKKKIGKIENALDKIDELSGFLYVANDIAKQYGYTDDEVQVGLSAQAAKRVQPEVVKPAPFDTNPDGTSKSGENYLTIQYERLVPLLVEGIKELRQELNSIKQQLK